MEIGVGLPTNLRSTSKALLLEWAQRAEAAELSEFFDGFAAQMPEPFYRDYVKDDLAAIVTGAGLRGTQVQRAWLSKVVHAKKPTAPGSRLG